jgi:hypothetical protein
MAFVIKIDHPEGEQWLDLVHEPYVESVEEALSLPPAWAAIRLKSDVTEDQANAIANQFRARIDAGTVTVEQIDIE